MNIGKIANHTRRLGAPPNWDAEKNGPCGVLHIRDELAGDVNDMVSAWIPTEEERAKIAAGAPILLKVCGRGHPPVMLVVGTADDIASE
jgi:hypothetical protein